jgi:hypothetical protein
MAGSSKDDDNGDNDVFDNNNDEEGRYNDMHWFFVGYDNDVLPSCDARITYVLEMTPLDTVRPTPLQGIEAALQRAPKSKRFRPRPDANALPYRLDEIIAIDAIAQRPINVTAMAASLPTSMRNGYRQYERQRRRTQSMTVISSLGEVEASLRSANGLTIETRRNAFEALVDTFAAIDQIDMVVEQLASPSSAIRLSAVEASYVLGYARAMKPPPPPKKKKRPRKDNDDDVHAAQSCASKATMPALGRFADFIALSDIGTRRRLRPSSGSRRRFDELPAAKYFDQVANIIRSSSSTTAVYYGDPDEMTKSSVGHILLERLHAFRQVGVYTRDDRQYPVLAGGRDDTLEREAARLLHDTESVAQWWSLTVQSGSFEVYTHVMPRINALIDDDDKGTIIAIAPTVAHALAMPFDCLSMDDVLAGAIPRRRHTTLILVVAHAFGVDSFVHAVRLVIEAAAAGGGGGLLNVVMIGDHLNSDGSPRESDRGTPMRDITAAIRHGHLGVRGHIDMLLVWTNECSSAGCLNEEEWQQLRRYSDNEWPSMASWTRYDSLDDVNSRDFVVVGCLTISDALKAARATLNDANKISQYIMIDELGQVAAVRSLRRVDRVVSSLDELANIPTSLSPYPSENTAHVATRSLYVELQDTTINHRHCCRTAVPTYVCVAAHPSLRSLVALPARHVARVAQRAVVDSLVFIVTERTGIEDVRAAFSLARHHVHVVGSESLVAEAVRRHAPRPRTRLVELSTQSSSSAPMPILAHGFDVVGGSDVVQDHSFSIVYTGSTDRVNVVRTASGIDEHGRWLVSIDQLRRHTIDYLRPTTTESLMTTTTTTTHAFNRIRLTPEFLTSLTHKQLDAVIMHRLWALVGIWHQGRLGDDNDEGFIDEQLRTYIDEYTMADNDTLSREAAAIHALSTIVKRRASTWYIEAERRLFIRVHGENDSTVHAQAVVEHINRVLTLPDGSDEAVDDYDLFAKLRELRTYIEHALDVEEDGL